MFRRRDRLPAPAPTHSLDENIGLAAAYAYDTLARALKVRPDTLKRARYCHDISRLMLSRLVTVEPNARTETNYGGDDVDYHSFVVVPQSEGDVLADGQWQQMVPPDKKLPRDAPAVLIGTRDDMKEELRSFGVPERTLRLWEDTILTHHNDLPPYTPAPTPAMTRER